VRLITEEVGGITKEKRMDLVGSLASGHQFFRYDFGEGEAVARKKGNKPRQATLQLRPHFSFQRSHQKALLPLQQRPCAFSVETLATTNPRSIGTVSLKQRKRG
jgi:hypothetical protein